MKIITVNASKKYDVIVGDGILSKLDRYIHDGRERKACIISDTNVWALYGPTVASSLEKAGYQTTNFVFEAGEEQKNPQTYLSALDHLCCNHYTRTDLLVALGGGVVGDLTGFVAATFLRGIDYIQIPTSLLAMVDSSVGGKTAIDLPAGKNLVGAFYQPKLVLCDISVLETLPFKTFQDGCAEVLKYAILYDPCLFTHMQENVFQFDREYVISQCITLKRNVVDEDEFDKGTRQRLNLGHTIGHGIESASQFAISHGNAVATGIAIVTRSALEKGLCDKSAADQILNILQTFKFSLNTAYSAEKLLNCALSDKKRAGNTVNLIVPNQIGICSIYPVPVSELHTMIEAGL